MNFSFLAKLIAALVAGLIVVFVIDPIDPTTVSTPFCLALILMGISLRQNTALVVAVSVFYSILTVYALIHFLHYFSVHFYAAPHPYFRLFQRLGLFFVVCAMAVYLAYYRTSTERNLTHIQNVLSKLPAPVVISDAAGYITYANDALTTVFKHPVSELMGKPYVDFFMTDIQEGKAMRYYIELFGKETKSVHELELKPFGGPVKMNARLTCLGTGSNRMMITVLSTVEEE